MANESPKVVFKLNQEFLPDIQPQPTIPYFVGFFEKGPTTATLVNSEALELLFGKIDVLKYGKSSLYPHLLLKKTKGVAYVRRALHVEDTDIKKKALLGSVRIISGDKPVKSGVTGLTPEQASADSIFKNNSEMFLVTPTSQGSHSQKLAIGITASNQGLRLFELTVYRDGTQIENYLVSRDADATDSFNDSLFIEDVINGNSLNIWVKDNPKSLDAGDKPLLPGYTNYMIVTSLPVPVLTDLNTTLRESAFLGDNQIRIVSPTKLSSWAVGDTISVVNPSGQPTNLSIVSIKVDANLTKEAVITIEGTIPKALFKDSVAKKIKSFTNKPSITLNFSDPKLDVGDIYVDSQGNKYKVNDSGINNLIGGQDGTIGQESDFIEAFQGLEDINTFPEELLISDGGFSTPAVFATVSELAKTRQRCAFYGSVPYTKTTLPIKYIESAEAYAESTLVADKYSRLFSGYSKFVVGRGKYWVNDHLSNIANQYLYTLILEGVLPMANNRGAISGIIEKDIELPIEYQDRLERAQINYSRKVGAGFTNMSNTTRFPVNSYFQLSHIIHYVNAVQSIVEKVFSPYLQEVVSDGDVEDVKAAIGNLLTRNLSAMTNTYEFVSKFLSNGNGTTTWLFKLYVQPRDITTKILFDLTVTNRELSIEVTPL